VRGEKPQNSDLLVPDEEEEQEEERKRKRKDVHSISSIHYQQFTGSSCYCHRLSIKVDVFQISVAIMFTYLLLC